MPGLLDGLRNVGHLIEDRDVALGHVVDATARLGCAEIRAARRLQGLHAHVAGAKRMVSALFGHGSKHAIMIVRRCMSHGPGRKRRERKPALLDRLILPASIEPSQLYPAAECLVETGNGGIKLPEACAETAAGIGAVILKTAGTGASLKPDRAALDLQGSGQFYWAIGFRELKIAPISSPCAFCSSVPPQ